METKIPLSTVGNIHAKFCHVQSMSPKIVPGHTNTGEHTSVNYYWDSQLINLKYIADNIKCLQNVSVMTASWPE